MRPWPIAWGCCAVALVASAAELPAVGAWLSAQAPLGSGETAGDESDLRAMQAHYRAFCEGVEDINAYPYLITLLSYGSEVPPTVLRELLEAGASTELADAAGYYPLHAALYDQDLLSLLLAAGADVEARDDGGCTPLLLAAACEMEEACNLLLAAGADVNARDDAGYSAFDWLWLSGEMESTTTCRLLLQAGAQVPDLPELARAVLLGDAEAVQQALAEGDAVNEEFDNGMTPLYVAALGEQVEICRRLLEAGADPRVGLPIWSDEDDELADEADAAEELRVNTPLHLAALKGNESLAALFIEHGAEVSAAGDGGLTPLHIAAAKGAVELCRLLLAAGADAEAKDDGGCTPLLYALVNGHAELSLILAAGAGE